MIRDATAAMVLRNEGQRIAPLVGRLRTAFEVIVIGVQEGDDDTEAQARVLADRCVVTPAHGFGDATFGPNVLPLVQTPWTFKVDGDEMPTPDLLASINDAVSQAESERRDGVWIPFRSWIDDIEWEQRHSHLRLFRTRLGWPASLHSRPMTDNVNHLPYERGWIEHRKSLDEHVRGYLTYLRVGRGNAGWDSHNTAMIYHACVGTAAVKGWDYVRAFAWWPDVRAVAFGGTEPAEPAP